MNDLQKRFALFLLGCIPARILLTYLATYPALLQYVGYVALAIGIGFLYFYLTGSRQTGPEVFGNRIWWNNLRPVHGSLYLLFSYLAIVEQSSKAWIVLAVDTLFGLISFLVFHRKWICFGSR